MTQQTPDPTQRQPSNPQTTLPSNQSSLLQHQAEVKAALKILNHPSARKGETSHAVQGQNLKNLMDSMKNLSKEVKLSEKKMIDKQTAATVDLMLNTTLQLSKLNDPKIRAQSLQLMKQLTKNMKDARNSSKHGVDKDAIQRNIDAVRTRTQEMSFLKVIAGKVEGKDHKNEQSIKSKVIDAIGRSGGPAMTSLYDTTKHFMGKYQEKKDALITQQSMRTKLEESHDPDHVENLTRVRPKNKRGLRDDITRLDDNGADVSRRDMLKDAIAARKAGVSSIKPKPSVTKVDITRLDDNGADVSRRDKLKDAIANRLAAPKKSFLDLEGTGKQRPLPWNTTWSAYPQGRMKRDRVAIAASKISSPKADTTLVQKPVVDELKTGNHTWKDILSGIKELVKLNTKNMAKEAEKADEANTAMLEGRSHKSMRGPGSASLIGAVPGDTLNGKDGASGGGLLSTVGGILGGLLGLKTGKSIFDKFKKPKAPATTERVNRGPNLGEATDEFKEKGFFGKTADKAKDLMKKGLSKVSGVVEGVGEFFGKITKGAEFAKLGKLLKLGKAVPFVGEAIAVVMGIFDFFGSFKNADKILGKTKEATTLWDKVSAGLGGVLGGLTGIFDAVSGLFGVETDVGGFVKETVAKFFSSLPEKVGGLIDSITAPLDTLFKSLGPATAKLVKTIGKDALAAVIPGGALVVDKLFPDVKDDQISVPPSKTSVKAIANTQDAADKSKSENKQPIMPVVSTTNNNTNNVSKTSVYQSAPIYTRPKDDSFRYGMKA